MNALLHARSLAAAAVTAAAVAVSAPAAAAVTVGAAAVAPGQDGVVRCLALLPLARNRTACDRSRSVSKRASCTASLAEPQLVRLVGVA